MDTISFFLRRGIQGIQILESIVFAGFLVFHNFSFFFRTVGTIILSFTAKEIKNPHTLHYERGIGFSFMP